MLENNIDDLYLLLLFFGFFDSDDSDWNDEFSMSKGIFINEIVFDVKCVLILDLVVEKL